MCMGRLGPDVSGNRNREQSTMKDTLDSRHRRKCITARESFELAERAQSGGAHSTIQPAARRRCKFFVNYTRTSNPAPSIYLTERL